MDFMHMHVESHFEASDTVRDIVIGMADGLTVPFALAAGLTGTVAATSKLVVFGVLISGGWEPDGTSCATTTSACCHCFRVVSSRPDMRRTLPRFTMAGSHLRHRVKFFGIQPGE